MLEALRSKWNNRVSECKQFYNRICGMGKGGHTPSLPVVKTEKFEGRPKRNTDCVSESSSFSASEKPVSRKRQRLAESPHSQTHKKKRRRGPPISLRLQSLVRQAGRLGAFRDRICTFLEENGHLLEEESPKADTEEKGCAWSPHGKGRTCWRVPVQIDHERSINMYVVREDVSCIAQATCDHCLYIGWSFHPVSNFQYHFIIPSSAKLKTEGVGNRTSGSRGQDGKEWIRSASPHSSKRSSEEGPLGKGDRAKMLESQNHILHGVIHLNGYGHLLRLNGLEGGSASLRGVEAMELWDLLSSVLGAREISVKDVSRKRFLELRLIHSIAYGIPWYGRWGYSFERGCFGITAKMYEEAKTNLQSMPLKSLLEEKVKANSRVGRIIEHYVTLAAGLKEPYHLKTLGELIRFLMEYKRILTAASGTQSRKGSTREIHRNGRVGSRKGVSKTSPNSISNIQNTTTIRWSSDRLKYAFKVIFNILKSSKRPMTRYDMKDAARGMVGDTGLIDYVLKTLDGKIVEGYLVARTWNPTSGMLEASVTPQENLDPARSGTQPVKCTLPSLSDINRDLAYLHKHLLKPRVFHSQHDTCRPNGTLERWVSTLLDSKLLVKKFDEWEDKKQTNVLHVACTVDIQSCARPFLFNCGKQLRKDSGLSKHMLKAPPPLVVSIPKGASLADLKLEAQRALREEYSVFSSFTISGLKGSLGKLSDEMEVSPTMSQQLFTFLGNWISAHAKSRSTKIKGPSSHTFHNNLECWEVRCLCGTTDDDGERMVECEKCKGWYHTRCEGIPDTRMVPDKFSCSRCAA